MDETDKHLENKPWLWKKGQSGNPKGRPKGKTAKERAKEYLASMTDEEFEDFLEGIDKKIIWEMAEGKPKQDIEHGGAVTISHLLDSLENDGQKATGQGVEVESLVQNQEQGTKTDSVQQEQTSNSLQPEQVVS